MGLHKVGQYSVQRLCSASSAETLKSERFAKDLNFGAGSGASFNISSAIGQSACAGPACAMGATIDGIALFYAMTKNPAPAMVAGWRDGLNCTFKTVKNMRPAGYC
jgi:hypothetical protein